MKSSEFLSFCCSQINRVLEFCIKKNYLLAPDKSGYLAQPRTIIVKTILSSLAIVHSNCFSVTYWLKSSAANIHKQL